MKPSPKCRRVNPIALCPQLQQPAAAQEVQRLMLPPGRAVFGVEDRLTDHRCAERACARIRPAVCDDLGPDRSFARPHSLPRRKVARPVRPWTEHATTSPASRGMTAQAHGAPTNATDLRPRPAAFVRARAGYLPCPSPWLNATRIVPISDRIAPWRSSGSPAAPNRFEAVPATDEAPYSSLGCAHRASGHFSPLWLYPPQCAAQSMTATVSRSESAAPAALGGPASTRAPPVPSNSLFASV